MGCITFVTHQQGNGACSGRVRKIKEGRALAEDCHHLREGRGTDNRLRKYSKILGKL